MTGKALKFGRIVQMIKEMYHTKKHSYCSIPYVVKQHHIMKAAIFLSWHMQPLVSF